MLRILSSIIFPHFLLLVGLNFINGLYGSQPTGPAFMFADKLDMVPAKEFNDILKVEDTIWVAGDGLYKISDGEWSEIFTDERVTALAWDQNRKELVLAAASGVGRMDPRTGQLEVVVVNTKYVWEMVLFEGQIWYFGSDGYGWIDLEKMQVGGEWEMTFQPRPISVSLNRNNGKFLIGTNSNVWEISKEGAEVALTTEMTNNEVIVWMEEIGSEIQVGTNRNVYSWTGNLEDPPELYESNYSDYFEKGISNTARFGDTLAITEYPVGIALYDMNTRMVAEYIRFGEDQNIGNVFKIREAGEDELIVLGGRGVGTVDLASDSRFYPYRELFQGEAYRTVTGNDDQVIFFSDDSWVKILEHGYLRKSLPTALSWTCLNLSGTPVYGSANSFETLSDDKWQRGTLEMPIGDYVCGENTGYALGASGIYTLDMNFKMTQIYPNDGRFQLIGEYDGDLYLLDRNGRINVLRQGTETWQLEETSLLIEAAVKDKGVGDSGVWLSSADTVYNLNRNAIREFKLSPGWAVVELDVCGWDSTFLFFNENTRGLAVGLQDKTGPVMLAVPFLEQLGEPLDIFCNADRIGIVGTRGVGWFAIDELERVTTPEVNLDLLFENKRIEERTIRSGMHYIDLQVEFANPEIPCEVQYRINEQRWRTVNLQDPVLPFAGHGNFIVELRAIHPNGITSPLKVVQFGISPPWYLNPIYQGLMLLMAIGIVGLLYYLRSRQLKRTNLWLQSEVRKQTRELEAATAARTNFLAGLSHDIRNPLNGVLMIAETLTRNPPKSGDDQRLQDLTEFGVIVDRMLGEILDFSTIDQSNIPTAFIPVSVADIIDSTVKQNQYGIQHEMVILNKVIPDELKDVVIRTDRNWMIKILSNLLINSLEYSESERIEVGAKCNRITDTEVELEIYVSDWGLGIDDSEKEYIFERFYRGESGIESGKHGTGLGLSICLEIAHAMGAHLFLEDNEPSGCRFILRGKFDRVEGQKELDKDAILNTLSGKRILIVDDLVYNRKSILEFFETIGCQCDEAENGREALGKLSENEYYLALLDWDLPGLTGPEIARRHRKANPDDKVILVSVTAYTDGEKKRESEEAGMNGYISKPLTATRLAYCLANIEDWKPWREKSPDLVDTDEVIEEIYKHIEECLLHGERYEWENLRRCAHRLTTLALMRNNRAMQQVCRDLQVSAQNEDLQESQTLLLELHQWRRP